ncbi:MAG: exodeoxyribonuclease III [Cyanobacteria bacterium SZAS LIN-2]|nr:exodeoxyribonuclease III [Cyanobacteria bacterium SZAS LIN-3]MBS1995673.1 exodeoxyribonuclease III [Cyanobacteria bacterium SZAS LIN-2]
MAKIKLASWNINGIRAIAKRGLFEWLSQERPDILCLQETKISADQLTNDITEQKGYKSFFSHAEKRGYSGVGIYTKIEPISVRDGFGVKRFDSEGRTLVADYGDFILANIYFPNGSQNEDRLKYKLEFYDAFYKWAAATRKAGKKLIVCGDFNTAHKEIDIARPKENAKVSGFMPIEREWMDKFLNSGFHDTFRLYNQEPHNYSWWHMRSGARERNVGWRIDYFMADKGLENNLQNADILQKIQGSDHCPVTLELKV